MRAPGAQVVGPPAGDRCATSSASASASRWGRCSSRASIRGSLARGARAARTRAPCCAQLGRGGARAGWRRTSRCGASAHAVARRRYARGRTRGRVATGRRSTKRLGRGVKVLVPGDALAGAAVARRPGARLPSPPAPRAAARHHVLRARAGRATAGGAAREVEALGVRLEVVPLGLAGAGAGARAAPLVGDRRPLQVLLYDAPTRARRRVAALIAAGGFDVVHAQLVRDRARICRTRAGRRWCVDLIDALSANFARRARQRARPARAGRRRARRAGSPRFERALIARARARARRVGGRARRRSAAARTSRVVPNGVDVDAFAYRDGAAPAGARPLRRQPRLLPERRRRALAGRTTSSRASARRVPRRGAAARRARDRRARCGRWRARPACRWRRRAGDGAGDRAAPPSRVVPMRAGSGLQNKVLEAMAVGTPVVATPRAVAALDVRPGEHLLVADDAAGLAAATVALLRDPARARAHGGARPARWWSGAIVGGLGRAASRRRGRRRCARRPGYDGVPRLARLPAFDIPRACTGATGGGGFAGRCWPPGTCSRPVSRICWPSSCAWSCRCR